MKIAIVIAALALTRDVRAQAFCGVPTLPELFAHTECYLERDGTVLCWTYFEGISTICTAETIDGEFVCLDVE